ERVRRTRTVEVIKTAPNWNNSTPRSAPVRRLATVSGFSAEDGETGGCNRPAVELCPHEVRPRGSPLTRDGPAVPMERTHATRRPLVNNYRDDPAMEVIDDR